LFRLHQLPQRLRLHHGARESIEQKPAGIPQKATRSRTRSIPFHPAPARPVACSPRRVRWRACVRWRGRSSPPEKTSPVERCKGHKRSHSRSACVPLPTRGAQQNQPPRPASLGGAPAPDMPRFNPCRIVPFLCHKKIHFAGPASLPDRLSAIRNPPTVKPLPRTSPISRFAKNRESSDNRDRKNGAHPDNGATAPNRQPRRDAFLQGRPAFTARTVN
jgi:hypothetical protein